jgi:hypothetical protein
MPVGQSGVPAQRTSSLASRRILEKVNGSAVQFGENILKTRGALKAATAVIRIRKARSTLGCREIAQLAPLASHPGIGHSDSLEELLRKQCGAAWNQAPTK